MALVSEAIQKDNITKGKEIFDLVKEKEIKFKLPEIAVVNKTFGRINDLRNENLLIREVGSGTRKAMLDSFREAGLKFNDLNIKSRLGSTEAIIAAVQSGLGISFVSKFASSKAKKYGRVEEFEVKDVDFKRKFYLAYNRNKEESELIEKVIKLLND